jgi:hypothetical protein
MCTRGVPTSRQKSDGVPAVGTGAEVKKQKDQGLITEWEYWDRLEEIQNKFDQ